MSFLAGKFTSNHEFFTLAYKTFPEQGNGDFVRPRTSSVDTGGETVW